MEDAYSILATRHKFPDSKRYRRLMEFLLTPLQAQLAVELPATTEELAQRVGLTVPDVVRELDDLFHRGIIYPKEPSQPSEFKVWGSVDMLFYSICAYDRNTAKAQRGIELWADFSRDWYARIARDMEAKKVPEERVVPAYKAVKDFPDLQPCEDMRELIKSAQVIAVVDCPCRLLEQKCHGALDTCFMFDKLAEITVAQGFGRRLTVESAMALIDKAAEEGQVHVWINSSFMHHRFMCNCCDDCCILWAPLIQHGIPVGQRLAKSRFQSAVDFARCPGDCPVCVNRCLFHAIELKQLPGWSQPKAVIDPAKCWGCGMCVLKCEPGAISMKLVRPLDHIPGLVPA